MASHASSGHICGCYYTSPLNPSKRRYLPQVKLESRTTINPVCFTTTLTQTFHSPTLGLMPQVRYAFPLYDGICVQGYAISYGDVHLSGTVEQQDDAKQIFQAAVNRGETAGLLESLPAGVFGVTLGNVPQVDLIVQITYCGELKHDAAIDGLRYMLPTSIAPRYGDYPGDIAAGYRRSAFSGAASEVSQEDEGISITVDIDMGNSAIRRIQSPSHPIAMTMGSISTADPSRISNSSQGSVTLALDPNRCGLTELGGDFILQLLIDDISKPQAFIETHPDFPNQRALMTTLVPRFTLPTSAPEIVFIADQSGSMQGNSNDALVKALKVFLKSLPFSARFNIVAFGSGFKFLWPRSQPYNERNVNMALSFVDSLDASYGGTEILPPIKATFEQRIGGLSLEVVLLTDGEIWDEDGVFSYITSQIQHELGKAKANARIFSLGIGSRVSHTLVEGVARAGQGFAQFVTQNEDIDAKVMRMLKGALYAHTSDYTLEVHYQDGQVNGEDDFEVIEVVDDCLKIDDRSTPEKPATPPTKAPMSFFDNSAETDKLIQQNSADRYSHLPIVETPKLLQAPSVIPPLFPFNRTTLYLLLGPESCQKSVSFVTLRATADHGIPLELSIPVQNTNQERTGTTSIHQLAARKAIQDLEEGRGWLQAASMTTESGIPELVKKTHANRFDEIVEREAVRLGKKFQVASKWTSFVAVDENSKKQDVGLLSNAQATYRQASHPNIPFGAAQMPCKRKKGSSLFGSSLFGSSLFGSSPFQQNAMHRAMPDPPPAPATGTFGLASTLFGNWVSPQPAMPSRTRACMSQPAPSDEVDGDCEDEEDTPFNPHVHNIHTLIALQTFSGAWSWTRELAAFFAMSDEDFANRVAEMMRSWGSPNSDEAEQEALTATVMAVAWLEKDVPEKKEVWEMVAEKARTWLEQQLVKSGGQDEGLVQGMVDAAKGF